MWHTQKSQEPEQAELITNLQKPTNLQIEVSEPIRYFRPIPDVRASSDIIGASYWILLFIAQSCKKGR